MKLQLIVFCYVVGACFADYSFFFQPPTEPTEEKAFEKLRLLEEKIQGGVESLVNYVLPKIAHLGYDANVTKECSASILKFLMDLKRMKNWACVMADATGKLEGGFFSGTLGSMGSYKQCLDVMEQTEAQVIQGKYCLVDVKPPLPPKPKQVSLKLPVLRSGNSTFKTEIANGVGRWLFAFYDLSLRFGVCIPSTCTKEDLNEIVTKALGPIYLNAGVLSCEVKEEKQVDTLQFAIIIVLVTILAINIICTFTTLTCLKQSKSHIAKSNASLSSKFIRAFCITENFEKTVNTDRRKDTNLDFLDGIRFISMTWVVLGHSYGVINQYMLRGLRNVEPMLNDILFEMIGSGFIAVDTFIFIGGTVLSYAVITQLDKKKFRMTEAVILTLCRVWRVWPGLFLLIGLAQLQPLIGSGPMWNDYTVGIANNCRRSWWANILFINNYYNNLYDMCLSHTWYLSVDFQLFIFGIIYLLILYKNPRIARIVLSAAILLSVSMTAFVTYYFEYPPTILIKSSMFLDFRYGVQYMALSYLSTHVHLGVYSVGLFIGTFIARSKNFRIKKAIVRVGWPIAFVSGLALIFGIHPWNQGVRYSQIEAIIYSASHKLVWAVLLSWISLACFSGNGGMVHRFLSWSGYRPLGQLSFLVYLVHYLVIIGYVADGQGLSDYSHSRFVFIFFGLLCVSHIIAFFLNIIFELPLIQITRIVYTEFKPVEGKNHTPQSNGISVHENGKTDLSPNEIQTTDE